MILLDTNIVSELMKAAPESRVENWLGRQRARECFLTAITEAELRLGVEILPDGRRRAVLAKFLAQMLEKDFRGRILPFDSVAAFEFAGITASRRLSGRPISQSDAQIAAITRSMGAALATRNVADFDDCGIQIVNPWDV